MTGRWIVSLTFTAGLLASVVDAGRASEGEGKRREKPSLKEALARLKVPPDWFASVAVKYDMRKPWKQARLEIRRLLGGDRASARQGMKLTYAYLRKRDIGNGHEYPLYLFLGGECAWALKVYEKRLAPKPEGVTHEYLSLASCYEHFGEHEKALETLRTAVGRLPKPPWDVPRRADVESHLGGFYEATGETGKARQHYRSAIRLYPTSKQPFGRHLLKKKAALVQAKLDLMEYRTLDLAGLRPGTYAGTSLGYKGDVKATVTVRSGRIAGIRIEHKEDIEQGATKIIPRRIVAAQSLAVDGITGATATANAVIAATFEALKKAGLGK